jgi:hypothetical protein
MQDVFNNITIDRSKRNNSEYAKCREVIEKNAPKKDQRTFKCTVIDVLGGTLHKGRVLQRGQIRLVDRDYVTFPDGTKAVF